MSVQTHDPAKFGLANANGVAQFARLMVAFLIMLFVATLYTREKIDAENFALGKENAHSVEAEQGVAYTASSVRDIKFVVDRPVACSGGQAIRVMWLGNSQLHTINQKRSGQHLAPFWLRDAAKRPDCFWPNGLSLPNASFQEYLALTAYVTSATKNLS